jgi:hypothetical protein
MSASTMTTRFAPSGAAIKPEDRQLLPFIIGVAIFLMSAVVSIAIVGLPH